TAPGTGADNDSSIQRGVDAADGGDTVNVEAGTYLESLTIDKAINIVGAVDGSGDAATTLAPPAATASLVEIAGATDADDVSIANFNFNGQSGLAGYGVRALGSADLDTLT